MILRHAAPRHASERDFQARYDIEGTGALWKPLSRLGHVVIAVAAGLGESARNRWNPQREYSGESSLCVVDNALNG